MSYEVIASEQQKARKAHVCTWCGEPIEIGETYQRTRFVFEGEPMVNKLHLECEKAGSGWDGEFEPGMFKRGTQDER